MGDDLSKAVAILRAGGLVAFPTETVYGLGADATNAAAVARIFAAKGRPATNPLIVHVADAVVARRYAADWPRMASRLAEHFWPGPLTLVVRRAPCIVAAAAAGLDTVGLRCPDHPLALQLLRKFDGPVAAPSANRSMRISPTTAEHVRHELGDRVDLILDGGACQVGIESTVLDLLADPPRILRPGGVSAAQLEPVIGAVQLGEHLTATDQAASSPGQQAVHYAPHTPTLRFEAGQWERVRAQLGSDDVLLLMEPAPQVPRVRQVICLPEDPQAYARRFYASLRQADSLGAGRIWVQMPPDLPTWAAVRDRLKRAAQSL